MNILERAQELVAGDRQEQYGDPVKHHQRLAQVWSVIFRVNVTARQVSLAMLALKLVREAHQHKEDNLVDAAGHLLILDEIHRREQDDSTS